MPERVLKKVKDNILVQWKICFFAALIVGFVAHFYKLANWLPNWDSLVFRYDAQNMIGLGRWFLPVVCSVSSFYDLPFLNGLLSILFHAIGAVLICKIFDVKKGITAALIGAVIVSFPTVTSVMMYGYVADGYGFSFMLSCMAAMYLTREKPNYIFSVILIMLSTAIYQAYITVTIMLTLLYLINELIYRQKEAVYMIKKSIKILISGVVGMGLYYLVLTILLKLMGTELLEYQGMDSTASLSNIDVWSSLYVIKHTLTDFFFDMSQGVNTFVILNCVIFAVTAIGYLTGAIKSRLNFQKAVLLCIYVLFLPIGSTALAFINSAIDYHNLMVMGYSIFYIFFVLLYEHIPNNKNAGIKSWIILIVGCFIIINQTVIANVSYHKAQMAYEKSYGTLIRIADRIEGTQGAELCSEILVIGALADSKAYSVQLPPDMTGITDGYILRADDETVGQSVLCSALNDYCQKDYKFIFGERKQTFLQKDEIKEMNCWPSENCIVINDGVLVIKLGEAGE